MHFVVLHFMTWPHVPSIYSIDPSICPFSVAVWSSYAFSSIFFFLSLFFFLFHSPKTWLSEYHGNFLLYWNYFSFSLSLFTSVNFWQWHPTNSCAIVILSKLGRFRFNIATYQHILFAFDRTRSNSIWLTMKPSKFW